MKGNLPVGIETYISSNPLFSGFESFDVLRISQSARKIYLKRKEILFQIGDMPTGFYILLLGQIKLVFLSSRGAEKVVNVISEGKSFGEAVMFLERPYIVFAEAMQNCILLHLSKAVIFEEIEHNKALALRMLGGMANRIYELMSDIQEYSLQTGVQRTVNYLLRELPEAYDSSSALVIKLPFDKRIVASRLNLTQEHFSRILWELSSDGLIDIDGKSIHIKNISRLIDIAV